MAAQRLAGEPLFNASQLLAGIRYHIDPFGPTYITSLDQTLLAFHPQAHSESTLNRGDVVEVQGEPSSGKTQLLCFLCMTTALPYSVTMSLSVKGSSRLPTEHDIDLGGKGKAVVIFDTDNRFPVERVAHMMRCHITRRVQAHSTTDTKLYGSTAATKDVEACVTSALKRVHVFKPTSTISLAASIKMLPDYLNDWLPDDECTLVLVDSISAFYWVDRCVSEQKTLAEHPMKHVMSALSALRQSHGVVIVMTNWAIGQTSSSSPFYRQHLAAPFPTPFGIDGTQPAMTLSPHDPTRPLAPLDVRNASRLVLTHHITLHASALYAIPESASVRAALGEEGKKRELSLRNRCVHGHIRFPGLAGIAGSSSGGGRFQYNIGDEGLVT